MSQVEPKPNTPPEVWCDQVRVPFTLRPGQSTFRLSYGMGTLGVPTTLLRVV